MSETSLTSGLGWIIIDIAGVALLAFAAIYGILMWRRRRLTRPAETIGQQPGPAPKRMEGRDDRTAAS
ncbi:MAG TPA: hypothetical protein VFQ27_00190 [Xanthobacteraceae bacterium]|nr:hypothetical protein [Xanthobacteraceae bacterium]